MEGIFTCYKASHNIDCNDVADTFDNYNMHCCLNMTCIEPSNHDIPIIVFFIFGPETIIIKPQTKITSPGTH
jgi:hypothetical protein